VQNADETDADCGGSTCGACDNGQACSVDGDCLSSRCDGSGLCGSCSDGIQNGSEGGVDCDGPCATVCHCVSGTQDADETGVDCGGADCVVCFPSKKITISGSDTTGVKGAHTGFPVLVRIASDVDLEGLDPRDFRFTSDVAGLNALPFERESYDAGTGALIAWVKMDLTGLDQDFYLIYGENDLTDYSSPANVWSNFRHVWHQESTSSVDRAGSSSLGPMGTVNQVSAVIGNGTDFDGIDGYQTFTGTYTGDGALTISAWFKKDAVTRMELLSLGNGTWTDLESLLLRASTNSGNAAGGWKSETASGSDWVDTAIWYHVVWTFSGGSGGISNLYVNGGPDGTYTHTAPNSTGTMGMIGARFDNISGLFDGIIDEVRWANAARSADWVVTEYNNQKIGSTFLTIQ
jgi:hypothetical protein